MARLKGSKNKAPRDNFGLSRTRLYKIWSGIKTRCLYIEKGHKGYKNYRGRGIKICKEWLEFMTFRDWALNNGYKENLEIDRIDVNGDYCPQNCRWVTKYKQNRNKRNNKIYIIDGVVLCFKDWCILYKINQRTVRERLKTGMNIKDALTTPLQQGKKIKKL
jgi:hypothetical protein